MPRRWLHLALGLLVTGVFGWLLLRQLDLLTFKTAFTALSLPSLLVSLGFLAAAYTLRVIRWWWMLRVFEPCLPLKSCGWPFLVSIAVNNVLPLRAGDALRVVGFRKQLRSPTMRILGTLVIERLLDLMTLLGFFFLGLFGALEAQVPETLVRLAAWVAVGAIAILLVLLLFHTPLQRLVMRIAEQPAFVKRGWSKPIGQLNSHLFEALGLLRSPVLTLQLLVLSILAWSLEGAVFATVANAFTSNTSSLLGPWFAMATGTLATLLPSSPGYVGTFDYFAMLGLLAYGAERATATAFALTVHLVLWVPITSLGLAYFLRPGARALRRTVSSDLDETSPYA